MALSLSKALSVSGFRDLTSLTTERREVMCIEKDAYFESSSCPSDAEETVFCTVLTAVINFEHCFIVFIGD